MKIGVGITLLMKLAFLVVGWLILSYAQKGEKNYSSRDYVTAEILRLRNYTFCLTKKKKKNYTF